MIAASSGQAFAQLVQRVYGGKISADLARRVWDASRDGHTGIPLGSIDDDERESLSHCLIANGLLVMEFGQLYLPRFAAMEARIAKALLDRRAAPIALGPDLDDFIKSVAPSANDQQVQAVRAGLGKALLLLTGGPGTGKSFTLRALCAALKLQNPNVRIAASAPTANAAQRLADVGATSVGTIHKLLGLSPAGRGAPGRGALFSSQLALPFDVVIVDESSMLSAELADQLFSRLGPHTKLVLAGDRNQLASIDAGEVFSQACVLDDCVVTLTENRRFAALTDLSKLAQALLEPTAGTDLIQSLAQPLIRPDLQSFDALVQYALERYQLNMHSSEQLIHGFRLISPTNDGPFGVAAINRAVDEAMRRRATVARDTVWYAGRLIVIQRNDVSTGLRNGQTGVCLLVDNELRVRFDDERELSIDRIPAHSSAWAITVHKSQGAEYDEVVFVLPAAGSLMISSSLIYTAITRAKTRLGIIGDVTVLGQAGNQSTGRSSAIGVRLASA